MTSITPTQNTSFLHPSKKNKKLPLNLKTDVKISSIANQASKKNGTTWYTELPLTREKNRPVIAKLSLKQVNTISAALKAPQTKEKPTPPPRSPTTSLSTTPGHSEIDMQKKAFGPDLLSAVVNAKNALNPLGKKIPPIPLPRSDKTYLSSTSEHSNIEETSPPSQRRVSFQAEAANQKTHSPQILKTLPSKSILKKDVSFTEENKPHNEASASTKIHNPLELNEKTDTEKELDLAMDALNAVLKDLEIAPLSNFSK